MSDRVLAECFPYKKTSHPRSLLRKGREVVNIPAVPPRLANDKHSPTCFIRIGDKPLTLTQSLLE